MNFPDCKFSNSGIAHELVWGDIIFPLQAGLAERRNNEKISLDHLALLAWFYTIVCEKQYKNPVD